MKDFPGTVNENGAYMDAYERGSRIPERFQGDSADEGAYPVDKFTQNLLDNYALEGQSDKKEDGAPTGAFFLTHDTGRKVASEVLCTHFSKCGDAATEYLTALMSMAFLIMMKPGTTMMSTRMERLMPLVWLPNS